MSTPTVLPRSFRLTLVRLLCPFVFFVANVCLAAPVKFEIPAQAASSALTTFSKQSGAKVLFPAAELAGVQAKEVKGLMEPFEAITKLLEGTGYVAKQTGATNFVVKKFEAAATTASIHGSLTGTGTGGVGLPNVLVSIRETAQSAETDRYGIYTFPKVAAGTYVLVASAPGYQPLHITDVAVKAGRDLTLGKEEMRKAGEGPLALEPLVVHADTVEQLEKLEVTGSKQKPFSAGNMDLSRTIDDPKAYFIFDNTAIERSGATTTEEFLRTRLPMASNYDSGLQQNAATITPNIGTAGSISLRGFDATQTLVLLNGRRLPVVANGAIESTPDLNSIPVGQIERIEVLPSSASGIYGGSAVGGVINIITKRNYNGGDLTLTYNNSFDTDSGKRRADFSYGFGLEGGRTRVMIAASISEGNFLSVQDRYDLIKGHNDTVFARNPAQFTGTGLLLASTAYISATTPLTFKTAFGGQAVGATFISVPAGYRGPTLDGTAPLIANAGKINPDWPDTRQFSNGLRYRIYNQAKLGGGRVEIRRQMTDRIEAYAEASLDRNETDNYGLFSNWFGLFGTLPATNAANPFNQAISFRFPNDVGSPIGPIQTRRRVTVGATAKLPHDWLVLTDYTWNKSTTRARVLSADTTRFVADLGSGAVNLFSDFAANPSILEGYFGFNRGDSSFEVREYALRGAGPLPHIGFIQPTLAASVQRREEERGLNTNVTTFPGNPAANTIIGNLGGSQQVNGYYGEITFPMVPSSGGWLGLRRLDFQVAARRDDYTVHNRRVAGTTVGSFTGTIPTATTEFEDSYSVTKPTFGMRYSPFKGLLLRASFARGFLPPTAAQLIPAAPPTFLSNVTDPRRGGTLVAVLANPTGGNPNLVPETSTNWSGGAIFTPSFIPGLRISVDYTWIKKKNNISTLGTQVIINNEVLFPDRVIRAAVAPGDPFGVGVITNVDVTTMNLFGTSLEAYDISIGYQKATRDWGTFSFDALGTYTQHYFQRITFGSPNLEYVGTPSSGGPLAFRGNGTLSWTYAKWQVGWTTAFYNRYKVSAAPFTTATTAVLNNGGLYVPAQTYHDIFVRYRFGTGDRHDPWYKKAFDRTDILVGVKNVFNKAPAFDGNSSFNFYMSPYGDLRLATYTLSVKRSF